MRMGRPVVGCWSLALGRRASDVPLYQSMSQKLSRRKKRRTRECPTHTCSDQPTPRSRDSTGTTNDQRPRTNGQRPVFIIGKQAFAVKPRILAQFATITLFFSNLGEFLYRHLERRLAQQVREFLRRTYDLDLPKIVIEQPPKVEFGEYALPLAFELAKKLRKAPRKIAEEIVNGIGPIPGFEKLELAGAGYINARLRREELAATLAADERPRGRSSFRQDSGRALQHQSQQGGACRPPAQRYSRRHICPAAEICRQGSGCPELHRQHRRAGGRRGGGISKY